MSRRRSATGWTAGATVLTFTGSLAGSAAGAVAVAAGGAVAVSLEVAAGAVTTSAGLGSAAFAVGLGSAGFSVSLSIALSVALAASGTEAVESILKSPMVGGGTLAGSGRGTAASIASSAALARRVGDWAPRAARADPAGEGAGAAISYRPNPARLRRPARSLP